MYENKNLPKINNEVMGTAPGKDLRKALIRSWANKHEH